MADKFIKTKMNETLGDIVNIFAGGDGCIGYFKFRCMMESLEEEALKGDSSAETLCDVVYKFKKLIDIAGER